MALDPAEVRIAVLSAHDAFTERLVSDLNRVGLPCDVEQFGSRGGLAQALRDDPFDAVIVDHREPQLWALRADAVVGFRGLKVVVTSPDRFGDVHARYDRTVALGDAVRLAVVLASLAERRRTLEVARAARKARERAERRLDLLKEVSRTAVVTVRSDGTIESCNGAAERLLRLPEGRLVGRPVAPFLPSPMPSSDDASEAWVVMGELSRPDASTLSVEVRGFALPDGGSILLFEEEGGAEAGALRAARRRLDLLAEMLPGAIYIVRIDPDGPAVDRFVWIGPGAAPIFADPVEYTPAWTREVFLERIPAPDDERFMDFVSRATRTTAVESVEHRFRAPGGTLLRLRHYATAVWSGDRKVLALYGLVLDVTAETLARDRMELLSRAVEETAEMVLITERDGTIRYVNPAFERVTGYTAAEALGRNPRMLRNSRLDDGFYERMYGALARGESFEAVFENRRKNGEAYLQKAMITPVSDSYGVTRYVAIAREVDARNER